MKIDDTTAYYFFSTLAQVWAALIAFTGMVMRDRAEKNAREATESFLYICNHLLQKNQSDFGIGLLNGYFHTNSSSTKVISDNQENLESYFQSPEYKRIAVPMANQLNTHPKNDLISRAINFLEQRGSVRKIYSQLRNFVVGGTVTIVVSMMGLIFGRPQAICELSFIIFAIPALIASIYGFSIMYQTFTKD